MRRRVQVGARWSALPDSEILVPGGVVLDEPAFDRTLEDRSQQRERHVDRPPALRVGDHMTQFALGLGRAHSPERHVPALAVGDEPPGAVRVPVFALALNYGSDCLACHHAPPPLSFARYSATASR